MKLPTGNQRVLYETHIELHTTINYIIERLHSEMQAFKTLGRRIARRTTRTIEQDHMETKWIPTYAHHLPEKETKTTHVVVRDGNRVVASYQTKTPI